MATRRRYDSHGIPTSPSERRLFLLDSLYRLFPPDPEDIEGFSPESQEEGRPTETQLVGPLLRSQPIPIPSTNESAGQAAQAGSTVSDLASSYQQDSAAVAGGSQRVTAEEGRLARELSPSQIAGGPRRRRCLCAKAQRPANSSTVNVPSGATAGSADGELSQSAAERVRLATVIVKALFASSDDEIYELQREKPRLMFGVLHLSMDDIDEKAFEPDSPPLDYVKDRLRNALDSPRTELSSVRTSGSEQMPSRSTGRRTPEPTPEELGLVRENKYPVLRSAYLNLSKPDPDIMKAAKKAAALFEEQTSLSKPCACRKGCPCLVKTEQHSTTKKETGDGEVASGVQSTEQRQVHNSAGELLVFVHHSAESSGLPGTGTTSQDGTSTLMSPASPAGLSPDKDWTVNPGEPQAVVSSTAHKGAASDPIPSWVPEKETQVQNPNGGGPGPTFAASETEQPPVAKDMPPAVSARDQGAIPRIRRRSSLVNLMHGIRPDQSSWESQWKRPIPSEPSENSIMSADQLADQPADQSATRSADATSPETGASFTEPQPQPARRRCITVCVCLASCPCQVEKNGTPGQNQGSVGSAGGEMSTTGQEIQCGCRDSCPCWSDAEPAATDDAGQPASRPRHRNTWYRLWMRTLLLRFLVTTCVVAILSLVVYVLRDQVEAPVTYGLMLGAVELAVIGYCLIFCVSRMIGESDQRMSAQILHAEQQHLRAERRLREYEKRQE